MDQSYFYKADEVRDLANGNWLLILAHLAPELEPALKKAGKSHVTCPFHGGKADFRMFKDAHVTGGAICSCGSWHDGFELLCKARRWDFSECLKEVGDAVNATKHYKRAHSKKMRSPSCADSAKAQAPAKVNNSKYDPNRRPKFKGILIAHGQAPFQDVEENGPSYFAFIRQKHGDERKVWGVDLERAMAESGAQYGDTVTLTNMGREAVTVKQPEFDKDTGEITGERLVQTHRNTWVVEVKAKVANTAQNVQPSVQTRTVSAPLINGNSRSATKTVHTGQRTAQHNGTSAQALNPAAETESRVQDDSVEDVQASDQQSQPEGKVVPLFADQSKPWLLELQEEMQKRAERDRAYSARLCEKIEKVWNECLPFNCVAADPLRAYLVNRKLLVAPDKVEQTGSLRFHPEMPYYDEDGNEVGKFPAAVQAIRDVEGNLVTLHRTYLTKNGKKAKVECAKKMMPVPDGLSVTGGAVPLGFPREGILGLAEGLETALSAFRATNIPTWSTVNATLLESFEVPKGMNVHTVVIFADKDRSLTGEKSANALKTKLTKQGYKVIVLLPKLPIPARSKGVDWNDVLMTQGIMGFPAAKHLREFIARKESVHGRI